MTTNWKKKYTNKKWG